MANQNDQATLHSYAQALLELADARNVTDQVAGDVRDIAQIIDGDPTFARYLADPTIGHVERSAKLDHVFAGKTAAVLVAFLKLLSSKNRLGEFRGIATAFQQLLDKRAGNVDVEVTVPQEMTHDELEGVRQQISQKLGKNAHVKQKVDESIIGGLIVKVGDSLIDGSVKSQLETMKRRLVAAV